MFFPCSLASSMEQSPSGANRFSASEEIPPHFMEPNGSLPHSQVPATCPPILRQIASSKYYSQHPVTKQERNYTN